MCIIWLLVSCSDFLPSCLHNGCICWNIQCGEQNVISRLYIARMCKTWLAHICGELFSQIWCIRRWFWLSWLAPSPTRAFFVSSVRSSYSHPDLLVTHPPHFFRSHRSSTLDFHFLSHYSYIKAIRLYKGNHWTRCAGFMDASWVRLGINNDDLGILLHTLAYSAILWHTLAYSGILWTFTFWTTTAI